MSVNGLLNQAITLATKSGYDRYGRETVSTSTTVKARFQRKNIHKHLANGSIITVEAVAYVPADTTIAIDDKVTYGGVDYKVYGIYTAVDGTGNTNHLSLELIKWKAN